MNGAGFSARGVSLPELIDRSMRLGHRRVALQRVLMMEAAGLEVTEASRAFCQPARSTVPLRELDRMYEAAQAWARMVSTRGAVHRFEDGGAP
jgi:hypothetical protein